MSQKSAIGLFTFTASKSLVANSFAKIRIEWGDGGGPAQLSLSWSYPGRSKTIVPSNSYHVPEYVASSPYLVTVICPTGYGGDTLSNPGE